MIKYQIQCIDCHYSFEQFAVNQIVDTICPPCGQARRIVETVAHRLMTPGEVICGALLALGLFAILPDG